MLELERILENKPVRPPAISTLALRWQSACPPGPPSSTGICGAESPKEEEISIGEESKEASKVGFCEIQWQTGTLDNNNKFLKSTTNTTTKTRLDISSGSSSKDSMRFNIIKSSNSNNNLNSNTNNLLLNNTISSNASTTNNNARLDSLTGINRNARQLDCSKSIDSIEEHQRNAGPAAAAIVGVADDGDQKKPIKRNTSLISFKSLDFNLKTIYSSMKGKHSGKDGSGSGGGSGAIKSKDSGSGTASSSKTSIAKTPYVRVETVDKDETENLLTFPQSPYAHRGSFDKTNSQYLSTTANQPDYSRSQTSSPFLCISMSPNLRRSSTSDIIDKKPNVVANVESRRPSTSDLLRRARERKGSESGGNKMGRSVSQGGLTRGGRTGRRTSIAF